MARFNLPQRLRVTGAIVAIAALASASIFATAPSAVPEPLAEKAWPVSSLAVEPTNLGPAFGAYGRFEASQSAVLTSKISAWVSEVLVREGDSVVEGDLLVRLDGSDFARLTKQRSSDVKRAQAQLASARSELRLARDTTQDYAAMHEAAQSKRARHAALLARRLISQTLYDEVASLAADESIRYMNQQQRLLDLPHAVRSAEADLEAAQVALEQARADLAATELRAPFTGPVLAVHAATGELSAASMPLVEMAAADSFELRVEVPHAYTAQLQRHLAEAVTVRAQTPMTSKALELARLSRQVRIGQGGLDAFFIAPEGGLEGAIGQVTRVSVQLPSEANLVALPVQSIYENDRVYVIVENRLRAVQVERRGEMGQGPAHRVLVSAQALGAGSQVLTTHLPQAVSGLLVAPVQDGDRS